MKQKYAEGLADISSKMILMFGIVAVLVGVVNIAAVKGGLPKVMHLEPQYVVYLNGTFVVMQVLRAFCGVLLLLDQNLVHRRKPLGQLGCPVLVAFYVSLDIAVLRNNSIWAATVDYRQITRVLPAGRYFQMGISEEIGRAVAIFFYCLECVFLLLMILFLFVPSSRRQFINREKMSGEAQHDR